MVNISHEINIPFSILRPDSVQLRKENPFKSMDDSMDTMDLYRLFTCRENGSNTTEGSKSSDSSKPDSPIPKYVHFLHQHYGQSINK